MDDYHIVVPLVLLESRLFPRVLHDNEIALYLHLEVVLAFHVGLDPFDHIILKERFARLCPPAGSHPGYDRDLSHLAARRGLRILVQVAGSTQAMRSGAEQDYICNSISYDKPIHKIIPTNRSQDYRRQKRYNLIKNKRNQLFCRRMLRSASTIWPRNYTGPFTEAEQ